MEDKVQNLRKKYEGSIKGEEDVLAVRDEALLVLEEANRREDQRILKEVEDMLIELEFSTEENGCKCHRKRSSC